MLGQREKSNTIRTKDTTRRGKSEDTDERRKTKKIPRQDETILTKQGIPKQRKKILPASKEKCAKTYQQPDVKKAKEFGAKYGNGDIIKGKLNKQHGKRVSNTRRRF